MAIDSSKSILLFRAIHFRQGKKYSYNPSIDQQILRRSLDNLTIEIKFLK